jgi:four helix bundle protein
MFYRFEKLDVWKRSREFAVETYKVTSGFPKEEVYGLTSQLRRAAISVALNIAEGSDRKADKDFVRFLRIAIGSTEEVVTGLYIARDLGFVEQEDFDRLYESSNVIVAMLNGLIKSLRK